MRKIYFTCHCVCFGSQFELFRPQPLKYSVSIATHLAHIILWFYFYSDINFIAGCPSIAIFLFLLELNQMAFQRFFFFRVRSTLSLCVATVEEERAAKREQFLEALFSETFFYIPYCTFRRSFKEKCLLSCVKTWVQCVNPHVCIT